MTYAYSEAVAFESSGDLPYNQETKEFTLTHETLEQYARIIAYKVAHNISNGYKMDPTIDPITHFDCRQLMDQNNYPTANEGEYEMPMDQD
jgi:hypothetical protein